MQRHIFMDLWWLKDIRHENCSTCHPDGARCKAILANVDKDASEIRTTAKEQI